MWERQHTCVDCGAQAIAERLGDELGIDPAGIWIHATHSHTSPDFMGAWGGVPAWYLEQVTATIEDDDPRRGRGLARRSSRSAR
jgi:hypothetical protein